MLTCIYIFGMCLSHRFSGNDLSTPHKTDLKCPLNVCINLSTRFMQYIIYGTNSYCIPSLLLFLVGIGCFIIDNISLRIIAAFLKSLG